jgi:hypothetical protein
MFKMANTKLDTEAVEYNFEAECERLSMVILRQKEIINSLKTACYHLSIAMMQVDDKVKGERWTI